MALLLSKEGRIGYRTTDTENGVTVDYKIEKNKERSQKIYKENVMKLSAAIEETLKENDISHYQKEMKRLIGYKATDALIDHLIKFIAPNREFEESAENKRYVDPHKSRYSQRKIEENNVFEFSDIINTSKILNEGGEKMYRFELENAPTKDYRKGSVRDNETIFPLYDHILDSKEQELVGPLGAMGLYAQVSHRLLSVLEEVKISDLESLQATKMETE